MTGGLSARAIVAVTVTVGVVAFCLWVGDTFGAVAAALAVACSVIMAGVVAVAWMAGRAYQASTPPPPVITSVRKIPQQRGRRAA